MLHPVGPLRARVYWRRRLVVLAVLLVVVGAGAWGTVALVSSVRGGSDGDAVAERTAASPRTPALAQVVPSLSAVRTPVPPPAPEELSAAAESAAAELPAPAPVAGGPCTDEMLTIEVRTPGSAAVGSKPVFELVVVNAATVSCVRDLGKGVQELIMLDGDGARVWGSNDCFPESGADVRTLAAGEVVVFPVLWGGLASTPGCAAERTPPPPGAYAVRGRLDTKSSPDAPFTLT
ncbi:MucR family transcriptional regulator [Blastococcus sp. TF02-09]|uniref:MucR family transcriptional regulator n=1 Tax=Blastococcus sp. TF02-09 TaxID=2250576 RepID=UPI000DE85027|nr:MucR family transcriptional regulator [Blastococcus sp. TF02-9]RBY78085.1 MucR family transcriptional regulator [Blastococcus sp. TF02-9]